MRRHMESAYPRCLNLPRVLRAPVLDTRALRVTAQMLCCEKGDSCRDKGEGHALPRALQPCRKLWQVAIDEACKEKEVEEVLNRAVPLPTTTAAEAPDAPQSRPPDASVLSDAMATVANVSFIREAAARAEMASNAEESMRSMMCVHGAQPLHVLLREVTGLKTALQPLLSREAPHAAPAHRGAATCRQLCAHFSTGDAMDALAAEKRTAVEQVRSAERAALGHIRGRLRDEYLARTAPSCADARDALATLLQELIADCACMRQVIDAIDMGSDVCHAREALRAAEQEVATARQRVRDEDKNAAAAAQQRGDSCLRDKRVTKTVCERAIASCHELASTIEAMASLLGAAVETHKAGASPALCLKDAKEELLRAVCLARKNILLSEAFISTKIHTRQPPATVAARATKDEVKDETPTTTARAVLARATKRCHQAQATLQERQAAANARELPPFKDGAWLQGAAAFILGILNTVWMPTARDLLLEDMLSKGPSTDSKSARSPWLRTPWARMQNAERLVADIGVPAAEARFRSALALLVPLDACCTAIHRDVCAGVAAVVRSHATEVGTVPEIPENDRLANSWLSALALSTAIRRATDASARIPWCLRPLLEAHDVDAPRENTAKRARKQ